MIFSWLLLVLPAVAYSQDCAGCQRNTTVNWVPVTTLPRRVSTTTRPMTETAPIRTQQPLDGIDDPHCMIHRDRPLDTYNVTQDTKQDSVLECWEECKKVPNCSLFSFHLHKKLCSLFDPADPTIEQEWLFKQNFKVVVGDMRCLDCLPTVSQVVAQSEETGVRITDMESRRCLGLASASRVRAVTGKWGFKVAWKGCDESYLWVVKQTGEADKYRIVLHGHERHWALEWGRTAASNGSSNTVFLAKVNDNSTTRTASVFFINRAITEKNCKYRILGFNWSEDNNFNVFKVAPSGSPTISLSDVRITTQRGAMLTCPVRSVPRGKVLNKAEILFGQEIVVKCDPGFGIASLNYTRVQRVKCLTTTQLLPCTRIPRSWNEGEGEGEVFYPRMYRLLIGIIVFLSSIILSLALRDQCMTCSKFIKDRYCSTPKKTVGINVQRNV